MKRYTCAMCGGCFISDRPEEETLNELKENFGEISIAECAVVCDYCWAIIEPTIRKYNDRN